MSQARIKSVTTSVAKLATVVLAWFAIVGAPRVVLAQSGPEVIVTVRPQEPGSKTQYDAPMIDVTVVGGATLPQEKFLLTEPTAKPPVIIKASGLRTFLQGNETVAVVLVINGQEIWIGNDDIEPEGSPARYNGILKDLKGALQEVPFATAAPEGSKGMLITYADKPETRVPMGPLGQITSESLGTQKDYYGKTGTAMVAGIREALRELGQVRTARKAMIVIGDGSDSSPETAAGELAVLKKEADKQKIQTFAIIYKGQVSDAANLITKMIPNAVTVPAAGAVGAAVKKILQDLGDRYYLTFPGYDPKTKQGFKWDGKEHDLVLKIEKEEMDPQSVTLAPTWTPSSNSKFPWWIVVVSVVGLLLLLVIFSAITNKKAEEPAPAPMPMAPMVATAAAPPSPGGPIKTVMFSVNGAGEDGFPVVGWLVALNGSDAYKTHKLRSSGTKIGTKAPADLIINDGFMSSEHCVINCSPQGFVLVDNGSTNGTYVNDKKVSKHELVDNDTITLGKTNLKFKSIT